ncbi:MAG: hypothetical protein RJB38_1979 [Pseudomonadota bacterium]|jgi:lipopolysaccharide export system permease protein
MSYKPSRKPPLLDRYLFTEVGVPFFGGLSFFTVLFLMFQLLRLAEFFIIHGVPIGKLAKISVLFCASFVPFAIPISFLIALLLSFGRLSSDSELIAMKASGISPLRMTVTPLVLAVLLSVVSLGLNLEWIPRAERELKAEISKVGQSRLVSSIHEGTFNRGFFDLLVYADRVDSKKNRMEGVFIYDEREPKSPLTIVAKEGRWTSRTERNGGSTAILILNTGNIHRTDSGEASYQKIDFDEYRLFLKMEAHDPGSGGKPKMMPLQQLLGALRAAKAARAPTARVFTGELWRRIAVALAPLAFVLLGVSAGVQPTRSVKSGASLIALVVLLGYYGLLGWGAKLYEGGILPAWLSMQLGNLVAALAGFAWFRRTHR